MTTVQTADETISIFIVRDVHHLGPILSAVHWKHEFDHRSMARSEIDVITESKARDLYIIYYNIMTFIFHMNARIVDEVSKLQFTQWNTWIKNIIDKHRSIHEN